MTRNPMPGVLATRSGQCAICGAAITAEKDRIAFDRRRPVHLKCARKKP
jgi:hypothetical protein